jgi:hypothetical protein
MMKALLEAPRRSDFRAGNDRKDNKADGPSLETSRTVGRPCNDGGSNGWLLAAAESSGQCVPAIRVVEGIRDRSTSTISVVSRW